MRSSERSGQEEPSGRVDVWLREAPRDARAAAAGLGGHAAAAVLGRSASGLRVAHDQDGRPSLTGPAGGLQVSLSHSRSLAAAAVTALGPVGVDLEPVRPVNALVLARRWFPAQEAAWLAGVAASRRDVAFLALWTQKEAIAKALGSGLRGGAGLRQPVPRGPVVQLDEAGEPGEAGPGGADPSGPLAAGLARMRLAAVPGRPGLAVAAAWTGASVLAGGAVLAVACLGARADGAVVTVRLAADEPPAR